jgi:hypothetical protein
MLENEIGPIANKDAAVLDSWKEIASFLRRGVRTVQRWERTEGLPVRRHNHLKRGSVYALPSELESWHRARQFGFKVRPRSAEADSFMDELHRLQKLTLRQVALAKELRDMLAARGRIEEGNAPFAGEAISRNRMSGMGTTGPNHSIRNEVGGRAAN